VTSNSSLQSESVADFLLGSREPQVASAPWNGSARPFLYD
jgi:hypothetical protein